VLAGLIDEDQTVDLAAPCKGSNHVAILLNHGRGAFPEASIVPTIDRPDDIALGDFDGDGIRDLAVIARKVVAVHYGEGGGDFSGHVTLGQNEDGEYTDWRGADVNRDGVEDVVVSHHLPFTIQFYLGKTDRSFEPGPTVPTDGRPFSLAVADLDGNSFPDITACCHALDSGPPPSTHWEALVLLNHGANGFADPVGYWVSSLRGHRLADLDLDGALDLVTLGNEGSSVSIFKGNRAVTGRRNFVRGDADANGQHDLTDAVAILTRLFLGGEPLACDDAADADDSGSLNISDAVFLLNHLIAGGPPLSPPFPSCGSDTTPGGLTCESFSRCP
jgi:hypothetical protein